MIAVLQVMCGALLFIGLCWMMASEAMMIKRRIADLDRLIADLDQLIAGLERGSVAAPPPVYPNWPPNEVLNWPPDEGQPSLVSGDGHGTPGEADRGVSVPDEAGKPSGVDHDMTASATCDAAFGVGCDDPGRLGLQRRDRSPWYSWHPWKGELR